MDEKGTEAAFDAAEQKVREYPNCGKLIHMMASMVQGLMMMSVVGAQTEKNTKRRYIHGMSV